MITRYYKDNTVYFMGWKSNDKHRTLGMRIKTTRFIIPGNHTESYYTDLPWSSQQMLADIDKVFAMLDGKVKPDISLEAAFSKNFDALRKGTRISATYFDVRYYGIGTIHFFPTNKKLIDRLNRVVGRHRRWLPPADKQASSAFWKQYDQAEKFDKAFQSEVKKGKLQNGVASYSNPFWEIINGSEYEQERAGKLLANAMMTVLVQNGIDPDDVLEDQREPCLLLDSADLSDLEMLPALEKLVERSAA